MLEIIDHATGGGQVTAALALACSSSGPVLLWPKCLPAADFRLGAARSQDSGDFNAKI
jgi:hypothetical protein